ncbi:GNAT family N-acetyltransferase [Thioalbus denitrificans]|uniref:N-acetyltransferase domain-containing protein n=1 Tax=Thioalbus denitrificans TaxID=547122 RepID=A0A369BYU6_9GAMM|nr:GNAT family N-acetyltransferase [Thioalbus denitrificans]RCX26501.1 hypothetical protein DFQ59_10930 [Thioalbus denitrificans]
MTDLRQHAGPVFPVIRPAEAADFDSILALNARVVVETSPMDRERLGLLDGMADYHRVATVAGRVAGFLLAMREDAPYENDNHRWFAARLPRFLYVDRIVVGAEFAGRGIGSRLYRDLFDHARAGGVPLIACEYNIEPLNAASRAFHDRFGFREAGRQHVADGAKLVSLQTAEVGR